MLVLETPRLYLRHWVLDDWKRYRPLATDPRVIRYVGDGRPCSDEQLRAFIERQMDTSRSRGWGLWPIIHRDDSELIGFCGFFDGFAPEIEIGWRLLPAYWGQGLATEAARSVMQLGWQRFGFARLISVAHHENRASFRVMEKLGMQPERRFNHKGIDVIAYAMENPRITAPGSESCRPYLRLKLLPGDFAIARLPIAAEIPPWAHGAGFVSISRSEDELSILCHQERVPRETQAERQWRCLRLAGPIPFDQVGVLSSLLSPLAREGIPIFAVSTFSTDYVCVKDDQLQAACAALRLAGHHIDTSQITDPEHLQTDA